MVLRNRRDSLSKGVLEEMGEGGRISDSLPPPSPKPLISRNGRSLVERTLRIYLAEVMSMDSQKQLLVEGRAVPPVASKMEEQGELECPPEGAGRQECWDKNWNVTCYNTRCPVMGVVDRWVMGSITG